MNIPYENIHSEKNTHLKKVFLKFKVNFERRKKFIIEQERNKYNENEKNEEPPHEILFHDPPSFVFEYGNGK